jgi:hypothetical protein
MAEPAIGWEEDRRKTANNRFEGRDQARTRLDAQDSSFSRYGFTTAEDRPPLSSTYLNGCALDSAGGLLPIKPVYELCCRPAMSLMVRRVAFTVFSHRHPAQRFALNEQRTPFTMRYV